MKRQKRARSHWITPAILLGLAATASAQPRVDLPLEGYFRIGRFMPMRVENGAAHLSAEGAIATDVAAGRSGIVPMLMLANSDSLHAGDREIPLHPLTSSERLIGTTIDDDDFASQLFPNQNLVKIHLDPAQPLPGSGIAWESLDAVILQEKIDPANLLSAGIVVAVRSSERPDARWPWKQDGAYWVLRSVPAGPRDAIGTDAAYLPMQGWPAQQPSTLRRQVVIVGVLISLLLMTPLLMRSRWTIAAMLAVALLCGGAIEIWRRGQSSLQNVGGEIVIAGESLQQTDSWKYFTSLHGGGGEQKFNGLTRPILLDWNQAAKIDLRLQCDADGTDAWQFTLPANGQLAFLTRTISPLMPMRKINDTSRSPLFELARQMYLDADTKILGEVPTASESENSWPSVVVGRR